MQDEQNPCYLTLGEVREILEHHRYRFSRETIDRIAAELAAGRRVYTDPVLFVQEAPGLYAGYMWREVT